MYQYLENSAQQAVEREKAVYDKLVAQYNQLLFAATEGVYEITVRSQSGTIVIPVSLNDGSQVAYDLAERFSKRVDKVEDDLNNNLTELGHVTGNGLAKKIAENEEREDTRKRNL